MEILLGLIILILAATACYSVGSLAIGPDKEIEDIIFVGFLILYFLSIGLVLSYFLGRCLGQCILELIN